MLFYSFSPGEIMLLITAMGLSLYAQFKVRSTYERFSRIPSSRRLSGAQVARNLLRDNNIHDVEVEETGGTLSDHYDPRSKTLRLSSDIYHSDSLAAVGVAAHEVGHAVQHRLQYVPLQLRHSLVPVANLGSSLAIPLFIMGLIMSAPFLMDLGIYFFAGAVLFQFITLPVEFNASKRAVHQLEAGGYLNRNEIGAAQKVLNAAAFTYVAATAVAVMHLIRLLILRSQSED